MAIARKQLLPKTYIHSEERMRNHIVNFSVQQRKGLRLFAWILYFKKKCNTCASLISLVLSLGALAAIILLQLFFFFLLSICKVLSCFGLYLIIKHISFINPLVIFIGRLDSLLTKVFLLQLRIRQFLGQYFLLRLNKFSVKMSTCLLKQTVFQSV